MPFLPPAASSHAASIDNVMTLVHLLMLLLFVGWGTYFAFALSFWHGLAVFAAALAGILAMRWPALTSRERSPSKAPAPEQERRAA